MDDAFLVRRVERLGDLARDREGVGHGEGPAREAIGECRAPDEFEDQRRDAIGLFESVDGADIRVVQRGQEARFARETGTTFGVGGEVRRQNLDRDVSPELAVARAIDLAHAASAERGDDRVRAEVTVQQRLFAVCNRGEAGARWLFEKPRGSGLELQQRLDFLPQRVVSVSGFLQERAALLRGTLKRRMIDGRDAMP
jgi:hypothetical protein